MFAPRARAGGFELPDNGTQALGRGAAFVAKADDPTAIYWNPAGLARQRGTRLLVDANIAFHSFSFQRSGAFPDDPNDPATPWGGQPFPKVENTAPPFVAPFIALSSDFGTFDRFTAAVGVFGPPAIGNRTFPLGVQNAPAASRYDFVQSRSTLIYPTASVAYRVLPWLDLGVSAHLVVANFDQTTVSFSEAVKDQCKNAEYQLCDSRGTFTANATTFAGTFGAMVRPSENLGFGAMVRTPITLTAAGNFSPEAPRIADIQLQDGAATLYTKLPLMVRLGARWIEMDGDFELYDLELDAVYEGWSSAQGDGPRIIIPDLGQFKNIDATIIHRYKDTYGLRAGGAYNLEALGGVVSLRAGGYYDSPATDFAYTRIDFDTLTKIAGTLGVGYKIGAFTFDLAYAAVASIPRVVGSGIGAVSPINGAQQGQSINANNDPLPAVNEGAYRGFTHILSLGGTVTFDLFFGKPRKIHYGNRYEPNYVPEGGEAAKPSEEKKPAEETKKPEEPTPEKKPEQPKAPDKKKNWWEDMD
jgi:long-chain fatty acid transport protein